MSENHISLNDTIYQYRDKIKTCEEYLYGDCHLFALALKAYFEDECEIVIIWQHEDEHCNDFGFLAHAFVQTSNGILLDCRGIVTLEELKAEYIENEELCFFIYENTEELILDYIIQDYFDDFIHKEKKQLMSFIDSNILAYSF